LLDRFADTLWSGLLHESDEPEPVGRALCFGGRFAVAERRNGRTRRERQNADNLRAQRRQPCARCGQPIDYDAPVGHPDSFNAGHIKPWISHPELREDPSNLRPEHERCNKSAHESEGIGLGSTSRRW
jgi:hypothetical protein